MEVGSNAENIISESANAFSRFGNNSPAAIVTPLLTEWSEGPVLTRPFGSFFVCLSVVLQLRPNELTDFHRIRHKRSSFGLKISFSGINWPSLFKNVRSILLNLSVS